MDDRIIDGDRWIAERLSFLRERLTAELPDAERRAIEQEIETLLRERGLGVRGPRFPRFSRRVRRRR